MSVPLRLTLACVALVPLVIIVGMMSFTTTRRVGMGLVTALAQQLRRAVTVRREERNEVRAVFPCPPGA